MNTDFNCKLFDIDKFHLLKSQADYENIFSRRANEDVELLSRLGICRFVSLVDHDERYSVAATLNLIKRRKQMVDQILTLENKRRARIDFYPRVRLYAHAQYINDIHRLAVNGTNYLFLLCPDPVVDASDLDLALNKILYSCKLVPIFSDFNTWVNLFDKSFIDRLLNIKGAAFQFSTNATPTPESFELIKKILKSNNMVIFGTSSHHYDLNINMISKNISTLRNKLGDAVYFDMRIRSHRFLR